MEERVDRLQHAGWADRESNSPRLSTTINIVININMKKKYVKYKPDQYHLTVKTAIH